MNVLVCHRQRALVHVARVQAERHGIHLRIAAKPKDVLEMARRERPDLIVLGNDLKDPSTDDLVRELNREPSLANVETVVVKGILPDLASTMKKLRWPAG